MERQQASFNRIDEEIDDYEKEIQEYLRSTKQRNEPPVPEGPVSLSQGGGIKMPPTEGEGEKPVQEAEKKRKIIEPILP